ncbi:MAG: hypothetical protein WBN64_02355 [Candidatus Deferrimicrobium sp.]
MSSPRTHAAPAVFPSSEHFFDGFPADDFWNIREFSAMRIPSARTTTSARERNSPAIAPIARSNWNQTLKRVRKTTDLCKLSGVVYVESNKARISAFGFVDKIMLSRRCQMAKCFITGVVIPTRVSEDAGQEAARLRFREEVVEENIMAIEGTVPLRDPGEAGRRIRHAHEKGRERPPVPDAVVIPEYARHPGSASSNRAGAESRT